MNKELMVKHIIQCFRSATHHTFVFNMDCVGTCKCNNIPFPFRLGAKMITTNKDVLIYCWHIFTKLTYPQSALPIGHHLEVTVGF